MSKKKSILCVVPLPPPMAGVEQMSQILTGSNLSEFFQVQVLRSNIRDVNKDKGQWDLKGIVRVLFIGLKLFFAILRSWPNLVYLTISQNSSGLARDCFYLLICFLLGRPVVGHLHGALLPTYLESRSFFIRGFFLFFLRKLKCLIVLSNSAKSNLLKFMRDDQIVVVYNSINPFSQANINGQSKGKGVAVGFMGHLSVAKGYFDLLAAADVLLKKSSDIRFVFAGEKVAKEHNIPQGQLAENSSVRDWDQVTALFEKYPNNLELKGIVTGPSKEEFFHDLDIFVLPSHSESFPLAVLEALHMGLPLIVTPVGALPEFLKDGENCLYVRVGDSKALSEAIDQLAEDSNLRKKMSMANQALAKNYLIQNRLSEYVSVFESALP